ncbi:hypothetical protein [Rhizobium sp. YTU87027]|uniref:hypothetical protein n=1 Tax=Rhizobium sp. YTU87027 TaxID=3417741 RepID=UPI003D68AD38
MKLLIAKRRNLMGELEDIDAFDAVHRASSSTYLCPECGRYVRPYGEEAGPRFKHLTTSPTCSYSGGRKKRQTKEKAGL